MDRRVKVKLFLMLSMNNISCWNVRGFNPSFKMKDMVDLIRENKIGLCGIVETRVAKNRVNSVFNKMFRRWKWMSNVEKCEKNCRIVLGWDPGAYVVTSLFDTDQVMHCVVEQLSSGN